MVSKVVKKEIEGTNELRPLAGERRCPRLEKSSKTSLRGKGWVGANRGSLQRGSGR